MIALQILGILNDLGCEVLGPVSRLDAALKLAQEESFDAAILDVTIRGGQIFPVAELLLTRGVPFVIASGYGEMALPEALRAQHRLRKPFTQSQLEDAVRAMCKPPARAEIQPDAGA
jgi:two-component SAPR family response regulator